MAKPTDYERHLILNHAEDEDDTVKRRALETLEEMEPQGGSGGEVFGVR